MTDTQTRKAGFRWAASTLVEWHQLSKQHRTSVCLLYTAQWEELASLGIVSVGEQSQAVKMQEEEAAVTSFYMHWSTACRHYHLD